MVQTAPVLTRLVVKVANDDTLRKQGYAVRPCLSNVLILYIVHCLLPY